MKGYPGGVTISLYSPDLIYTCVGYFSGGTGITLDVTKMIKVNVKR